MTRNQKLELTWVGKENRPRLEPRVLVADEGLSHHAVVRRGAHDIFDNMLIHGDNLLALKALEAEYAGKVKCVYIDPPFNTQQALPNYEDGLEHSIWLGLLRDRIEIIHRLLREDGAMFIHIDDNEMAYLIVLLDEIFGRRNRISVVTFKQGSATGHKSINPGVVSTTNFVLLYAKDKHAWAPNRVYTSRAERDARYSQYIENYESNYEDWRFSTLTAAFARQAGLPERGLKKVLGTEYEPMMSVFVAQNANRVVRFARPDYKAVSEAARQMIDMSKSDRNKVLRLKRADHSDMYFWCGERVLFYSDKLKFIDGSYVAGEPLTSLWDDILSNNLHNEGGVEFPKGKKPEALIKRCIELATNPGDLVLDSFAGSGTTGAVAHKMGRRWIMVELGEHAHTHIVPRLRKVIDGEDPGGVTKATGWQGGGGYRYYRLAPSLMEKDRWGREVISKAYDAAMLAEALCKLEGFTYAPDPDVWWMHGRSTDTDFIHVTTQTLGPRELAQLSDEVGEGRTLLVLCAAWVGDARAFDNLTLRKIPNHVRDKCEWGKDDYSLNVANLPMAQDAPGLVPGLDPADPSDPDNPHPAARTPPRRGRPPKAAPAGPTLFDDPSDSDSTEAEDGL